MQSSERAPSLLSKAILCVAFLVLSAYGFAQTGDVSRQDANTALQTLRQAIQTVLNVPARPSPPLAGAAVVTRGEVIDQLYDLYVMSRPAFRQQFAPIAVNQSAIDEGLPARSRAKARELVRLGLVAPIGPLVTNTRPGLTPEQFGDALGFFVGRLSEFTHTASARWSPHLMRP